MRIGHCGPMRAKKAWLVKSAAPSADSCTEAPSSAAVWKALFCPAMDPTIPARALFKEPEMSSILLLNLSNADRAGPFI